MIFFFFSFFFFFCSDACVSRAYYNRATSVIKSSLFLFFGLLGFFSFFFFFFFFFFLIQSFCRWDSTTARAWTSKTMVRHHLLIIVLFCTTFVALFYETPFFGPVLKLNAVGFHFSVLFISAIILSMYSLERRFVTVHQVRAWFAIGIPITQQALFWFQLNNDYLEHSDAERYLSVRGVIFLR
jgi:hypothetical protein